jgi:hypothetical protein
MYQDICTPIQSHLTAHPIFIRDLVIFDWVLQPCLLDPSVTLYLPLYLHHLRITTRELPYQVRAASAR